MAPGGGGEVHFSCPVRQTIKPVQLTDPGKIKRIRGTAYPTHLLFGSPVQMCTAGLDNGCPLV